MCRDQPKASYTSCNTADMQSEYFNKTISSELISFHILCLKFFLVVDSMVSFMDFMMFYNFCKSKLPSLEWSQHRDAMSHLKLQKIHFSSLFLKTVILWLGSIGFENYSITA
jgi:hypothetical protein